MRGELILKLEDNDGVTTESSLLELGLQATAEAFQDQLKHMITQQMPHYLPSAFADLAEAQRLAEELEPDAEEEQSDDRDEAEG